MSSIVPFAFDGRPVRVVTGEDGAPWFVAKDVAEALDYVWNGTMAIKHVPDEWRGVRSVLTPSGYQDMAVLAEQGTYFFLGRSDKPKALPFQRWLAGDVIPAVRKTGVYIPPGASLETLPPEVARQIGGIVKSVIGKQIAEALRTELPALLHGELARQRVSVRHGKTAGQVWREHGFPPLKGAAPWFSNRLTELGCRIEGNGCSESGSIASKLFDPDKVASAMTGGLRGFCRQYVQQRQGQVPLFAARG